MFSFVILKLNRDNITTRLAFVFLLLSMPAATLAQPQEAIESNVQNCHFINKIEGSSGYGKKVNWQNFAKYSALTQAEQLGASHVVWERFTPIGAFNGTATAKAYSCDS
ncbi:MAG: hypothetical protein EPN17_17165 [Methylobacter sp.]|nr:MAG: hypothetical protein EPN17_17165 [Methylobacter sp.]